MDRNLHQITGNDRLSKYVDSDYLGSGQLDLDQDYILTIDKLWQGKISTGGKAEQQIVISFKERTVNGVDAKPMILNATNRRTLKTLFGSDSAATLEGKRIIIYVETGVRDPRTGGTTEGLRIRCRRPPEPAAQVIKCADCGENITDDNGISAANVAAATKRRYGVAVCAECSRKRRTIAEQAAQGAAEQAAQSATAPAEPTELKQDALQYGA